MFAGAVIGTVMAFSAYRMTYAAIWDWRFNHIPLNRGVPFDFSKAELANSTFTRQVGWGSATYGGYGDRDGFADGHNGMSNGTYGTNGISNGTNGVSHGTNGVSNGINGLSPRKAVGSGSRRAEDIV